MTAARRHRPHVAAAVVVLTGVWVLLWDHPLVFIVLTWVLLALLVGLVFPLPAIELHGRVRLLGLVRLVLRLLTDVVTLECLGRPAAFRFGQGAAQRDHPLPTPQPLRPLPHADRRTRLPGPGHHRGRSSANRPARCTCTCSTPSRMPISSTRCGRRWAPKRG